MKEQNAEHIVFDTENTRFSNAPIGRKISLIFGPAAWPECFLGTTPCARGRKLYRPRLQRSVHTTGDYPGRGYDSFLTRQEDTEIAR